MPIVASDLTVRLSGGAANANPNLALGGVVSTTVVGTGPHNLFDLVSSAETAAGSTEYRCVYVQNDHATLTLLNAVVWISSNTPNPSTSMEIGLGAADVGVAEQSAATEADAPAGVTFSTPSDKGAALAIGDIPAGSFKAVWLKRIVNAGSAAYNNDQATIRFEGDTEA